MPTQRWTQPDGLEVILIGSPEKIEYQKKFITARHAVVMKYAEENGLPKDVSKWTLAQALAVHDREDWKDPLGDGPQKTLNVSIGPDGTAQVWDTDHP